MAFLYNKFCFCFLSYWTNPVFFFLLWNVWINCHLFNTPFGFICGSMNLFSKIAYSIKTTAILNRIKHFSRITYRWLNVQSLILQYLQKKKTFLIAVLYFWPLAYNIKQNIIRKKYAVYLILHISGLNESYFTNFSALLSLVLLKQFLNSWNPEY